MAEIIGQRDWWARIKRDLPEYRPRPHTGRIWLDILYVLLLIALQESILPTLIGPKVTIDLLTPWLAVTFIRQHAWQATMMVILAGFFIESHLSAPAGLYICAYWIMANVIIQARPSLSWRHRIPWLVTFSLSMVWIIFFESFVLIFVKGVDDLLPAYWLAQLFRFLTSLGFGLFLSREWQNLEAEEPVPT